MYHPRLYGAPYDMGLKYGRLLRDKAAFQLPPISPEKQAFGLASYPILQQFYPQVIEEIEGFAAGIEDTPERLGAFLLSLGIFETTGQCSVFAFRNDENTIVGRNYDMLFAFKKFTESSLIAPSTGYAYISQSDVFIGRSDGLNEKGLFIAMAFVNGTKQQPGVGFHFLVRKVLEQCATTAEAVALLQEAPLSSANNFLIADASGDLAVVEAAIEQKAVKRPTAAAPFLFITNQFTLPEMQAYDRGGVAWSKSAERLHTLHQHLTATEHLTLDDAKVLLADKGVCLNLRKEQFGTIWSVVADLNALTLERAETKPRPNNYKADTRLSWWLNKRTVST